MTSVLYTGNSPSITTTLTEADGSAFAITSGWTVTAGLRDRHTYKSVAGPWSVSEATSGSDWPNGIIVIVVDGSDTSGQTTTVRDIEVEVKVVDAESAVRTFVSRNWRLEKAAF